ncbi:MAG TPA: YXWGXW repeat-containing protein [Verrucomicrobiae bacterium]|nr:YXWGXW repeat-containing protein [Verrucomicrobiae bacterium]
MKLKLICAAIFAMALAMPASAQVGIFVKIGPPAVRYEAPPPSPGPGFVWMEGYWAPQGRRYVWVSGRWERAPYEGAYWTHPHYDHYPEGWRMHEGHWDREDHDDHYWRDHDKHDHDKHDHDKHDRDKH